MKSQLITPTRVRISSYKKKGYRQFEKTGKGVAKDITGNVFTYLTAVRFSHKVTNKFRTQHYWVFKCICNKEKIINKQKVTYGEVKSCGCMTKQMATQNSLIHGWLGHPIYKLWNSIKSRCYVKKSGNYRNYGGIGVTMCDEWKNNPKSFCEWCVANGWKDGLQIDKDIIANKIGVEPKLYSPERCTFVTPLENANNRRNSICIEFNGEKKPISEWVKITGISHNVLYSRFKKGYDSNKIFKPTKRRISTL